MWELDFEEGWAPKNWCIWTVVLEKTLESPLDCKEIQPIHSEGDQSWDFFGRNDAKAETPVLWPPHVKSWLIGKDSDDGRDWGQEEKGPTEDEMAGWHYWLDGRESEWTPGVGDGQGGLACCDSWGCKESDMTERLNWTEQLNWNWTSQLISLKSKHSKTSHKDLGWVKGAQKETFINCVLCIHCFTYVSNLIPTATLWGYPHFQKKKQRLREISLVCFLPLLWCLTLEIAV